MRLTYFKRLYLEFREGTTLILLATDVAARGLGKSFVYEVLPYNNMRSRCARHQIRD